LKYQIFFIPAIDGEANAAELNRFYSQHRVVEVEKHFVNNGHDSFWSFCVGYLDTDNRKGANLRSRIDYREILNEADFAVYAKLRTVRKQLAEADGVPPYAVFTNEQLATMVTEKIKSKNAMKAIDGVGDTRIAKYADAMLAELLATESDNDETPED